MRLFIAVNLPPETKTAVHAAAEPLREILPKIRWVPEELLHFTVKFLGERDNSFAQTLQERLDVIAGRYAPIPFTVGGMGAFPNLRKPAVVWINVSADAKLELLNHDVEHTCAQLGVELEGRPFRPHVTLARIREADPGAVRRFAAACDRIAFAAECHVNSVDLMRSEQRDGKLVYSALHQSPLTRDPYEGTC